MFVYTWVCTCVIWDVWSNKRIGRKHAQKVVPCFAKGQVTLLTVCVPVFRSVLGWVGVLVSVHGHTRMSGGDTGFGSSLRYPPGRDVLNSTP